MTLYFTFSRGGIAAALAGLVLYVVLAHPRGLIGALPAVGLPVAYALNRAYGADLLARDVYTGPGAREQGQDLFVAMIVAVVAAVALRSLALLVDRRLARIEVGPRARRGAYAAAAVVAALALVVAVVGVRPARSHRRCLHGVRRSRDDLDS